MTRTSDFDLNLEVNRLKAGKAFSLFFAPERTAIIVIY